MDQYRVTGLDMTSETPREVVTYCMGESEQDAISASGLDFARAEPVYGTDPRGVEFTTPGDEDAARVATAILAWWPPSGELDPLDHAIMATREWLDSGRECPMRVGRGDIERELATLINADLVAAGLPRVTTT